MELRNGVDLIEVSRIQAAVQRHGGRLLQRVFTLRELTDCNQNIKSLAARFAAKEAVAKALGTGIGRISWQEIEILRQSSGEPALHLHGEAAVLARQLGLEVWALSLSHTETLAIAFVVAMGQDRHLTHPAI